MDHNQDKSVSGQILDEADIPEMDGSEAETESEFSSPSPHSFDVPEFEESKDESELECDSDEFVDDMDSVILEEPSMTDRMDNLAIEAAELSQDLEMVADAIGGEPELESIEESEIDVNSIDDVAKRIDFIAASMLAMRNKSKS